MKILALITARGGSKRLPGKNTRLLGGKPVVRWTLDAVSGLSEVHDMMVSTDDPTVAEIARAAGVDVPWLRPVHLATDDATSVAVALHALDRYEEQRGAVDGLLLLQPTSPFRTSATVRRGIKLFEENGGASVVGVAPASDHPSWCFRVHQDGTMSPFIAGPRPSRMQDLPAAYTLNGAFYLASPDQLRETQSFITEQTVALVMDDPAESVDIDTDWDWFVANAVAESLRHRKTEDTN